MKRIFTGIFAVLLLACSSVSFAVGEPETRGNSVPTQKTTLPYSAYANKVYSYTYTAYKFKPNSGNKINVDFYAYCPQGDSYYLRLYDSTTGSEVSSTLAILTLVGQVETTTSHSWSNLNSDRYYYGKLEKMNSTHSARMTATYE